MTGESEIRSKLMRLLMEFSRSTQLQIKLPLPTILSTLSIDVLNCVCVGQIFLNDSAPYFRDTVSLNLGFTNC